MNENILLVEHIQRLEETLALVNQKLERSGGSGSGRSSSARAETTAVIEAATTDNGSIEEGQNYGHSRDSSDKIKNQPSRESVETISSYKSAQSDHTPIPHSDATDYPITTEAHNSSKMVEIGHNSGPSAAAAATPAPITVTDEKAVKGHNYEESEEDVDDDGDVWHTAEAFGSTLVLEEEEEY